MERLLFPLKELGVEGRRYLVFLEDFPDPAVRIRNFTVLCNSAGFGNISEVRWTLFSHLSEISSEVAVASELLTTLSLDALAHPVRHLRVPKLVSEHRSLRELDCDLKTLAETPVEELEEEDREMEAYRKKA